jgi:hypothetical protein
MSSWQVYVRYRRQKQTADAYAASRLQQQVFLAWAQEACQARDKAYAAVNMASRVQARVHNQTLFQCFAAWRARVQRAAAVQVRGQAGLQGSIIMAPVLQLGVASSVLAAAAYCCDRCQLTNTTERGRQVQVVMPLG